MLAPTEIAGSKVKSAADTGPSFIPKRRKLPNLVAEAIVRTIVNVGWPEDFFLGTEVELSARYNVSRATLREAVRELERHGAVVMRRGRGLFASTPSRDILILTLASFIRSSGATRKAVEDVHRTLRGLPAGNVIVELLTDVLMFTVPRTVGYGRGKEKLGAETAAMLSNQLAAHEIGARIGTEAELIQRCGVSRATLREALALLESQGLVERRRGVGGGLFRSEPNPRAAAQMAATYLHFLRPGIDVITDARRAVEVTAVTIAVQLANKNDLAWLAESISSTVFVDLEDMERNREFHTRIATISGNPVLSLFVEILMRSYYMIWTPSDAKFVEGLNASHRAIFGAIESGDIDAARVAMETHLDFASHWMRAGFLAV